MTVSYEINPPRITNERQEDLKDSISRQLERVDEIAPFCGGIHVTDSVLGMRRVSAMRVARRIKERHCSLQITISMRVRDRTMREVEGLVEEAASAGIDGVLILMGDPPQHPRPDSGLIPSEVARRLAASSPGTRLYLSLPSSPNFTKIRRKIAARPEGFVTQVIRSEEQVRRLCDMLKPWGFRIIPCIMLPSERNAGSAKILGLDWSSYRSDPTGFVSRVHEAAGDVLITSPSDFAMARDTLRCISTG